MYHSRKATGAIAAMAVAGLALSGCGGGGGTNQAGPAPGSAPGGASGVCKGQGSEGTTKGPATLSVAYSSDQEFNAGWQTKKWMGLLKSGFQKSHPGVTVKLVPIGGSTSDFDQKIALMLKNPSTAPDIIHEWTMQVGDQVEAGQIAPLESYLQKWPDWKEFPSNVRGGGAPAGHVWQMVSGLNTFGIYYNKNQLSAAGIHVPWQPKSWEAILSAARKVKAKFPQVIPLTVYAGSPIYDQTTRENFLPLLQGSGSPVVAGSKWVSSSPGLTKVFNFYHEVYSTGLGPPASLLSNSSYDGTVSGKLMPQQKVAIGIVGNWVASWWVKGGPSPWPQGVKVFRVANLPTITGQSPGFATQMSGSTFVLTCASQHRQLGAELLEYAESQHMNLLHVLYTGEVPPRNDVAKASAYLTSVPYFNKAENSWTKYATFTPSVNYSAYATCVGQVTGRVAAQGLAPTDASSAFSSCLGGAIGPSGVSTASK